MSWGKKPRLVGQSATSLEDAISNATAGKPKRWYKVVEFKVQEGDKSITEYHAAVVPTDPPPPSP
jgi:flavin-binding protein dodecin